MLAQRVASIPGGIFLTSDSGHTATRPAQFAAAASAPAAAFQAGKNTTLQAEDGILNAAYVAASEGRPLGKAAQQAVAVDEAAAAAAAAEAQCVMCWDAGVSVRLAPCGHKCMCR